MPSTKPGAEAVQCADDIEAFECIALTNRSKAPTQGRARPSVLWTSGWLE